MVIRNGKPKDLKEIRPHLIEASLLHIRQEPALFNLKKFTQRKMDKYYLDAIKSKTSRFFVAEVFGRIAGYIKVDFEAIPKIFKNNEILYMDDLYIVPEFRRMGIARSLLLEVEKLAKKKGLKRIQGRVYTFNSPMQNLMRSLGYDSPHATWDKMLE